MSEVLGKMAYKAHGDPEHERAYWGPAKRMGVTVGNPRNTSTRFVVKDGSTVHGLADSVGMKNRKGTIAGFDGDEGQVHGHVFGPMGIGKKNVSVRISRYHGDYPGDPMHGKRVATVSTF